ncbi:RDD family protein [Nitrosophilus alvini]|uniref:RDD family protein n=1 Tax=Nitrosophilus alvini TaxID=2714855 RepID=UPI00190A481F|nr:RDD family protein [Nitrosophilus alvini]
MTDLQRKLDKSGIRLGSLTKRSLAFAIDEMIVTFLFLAIIWDMLPKNGNVEEMINLTNAFFLEIVTIKIAYHTFFVWKYSATLGKFFMKQRVISVGDLETPSFVQAFNRAVFRIVSEMIFYLGFLLAFFDRFYQALHDKTAGTLVVDA